MELKLGDIALNFKAQITETTPVDWEYGDDCVILFSITSKEAVMKFPKVSPR